MSEHGLSETHRRTLGSRLAMMQKLIAQARDLGFDSGSLSELGTELARTEAARDNRNRR